MENVILHVYYHCHPGMSLAFVQALKTSGLQAMMQAEDGCIQYDYHISCEEDDTVVLLEKWRSAADLEKHLTQPHMDALRALKGEYIESTTLGEFTLV